MTIVIKAQNGSLVFDTVSIYREASASCDPKRPLDVKAKPTGRVCGGYGVILGEYEKPERAQEIIDEIFDGLEFAGSCKEYVGCPVFMYKMPKE